MLYKARNEAIKFYDDYSLMMSEAKSKAKQNETKGTGIKILTPKQMLQRLPIALAQVKAGNNSQNLVNEIRQIKDYNIMIDGRNFFDQPINSMNKTYENIRKIGTGKGGDYTTVCLLDYLYFKENYKMIAIDLSKQNKLDADPRAIQQINFKANLDRTRNTTIFFIIEEAKETVFEFSQGTV